MEPSDARIVVADGVRVHQRTKFDENEFYAAYFVAATTNVIHVIESIDVPLAWLVLLAGMPWRGEFSKAPWKPAC